MAAVIPSRPAALAATDASWPARDQRRVGGDGVGLDRHRQDLAVGAEDLAALRGQGRTVLSFSLLARFL